MIEQDATVVAVADGAALGIAALLGGLWLSGLLTGGSGAKARYRPVLLRRTATAERAFIEPTHPAVAG